MGAKPYRTWDWPLTRRVGRCRRRRRRRRRYRGRGLLVVVVEVHLVVITPNLIAPSITSVAEADNAQSSTTVPFNGHILATADSGGGVE